MLLGERASAAKIAAELATHDGLLAHGLVRGASVAYVGETSADGAVAARQIGG